VGCGEILGLLSYYWYGITELALFLSDSIHIHTITPILPVRFKMSFLAMKENDVPTADFSDLDSSSEERSDEQECPSVNDLSLQETNIPRLCCAFLASITTGGTTYAFGLYGNALKKTLHLSQSQLDTISTANFCAGLLSWIPGLLVDRYGTRFGISAGGLLGASSLMVYWNVSKGYIMEHASQESIVAVLSALGVTIFLSCALVTGSVFKIIVANCGPGSKGSAVGIAKGYVGLGAGAYACLFEAIRTPQSSDLDFLPMAAFFFVVCATIPSFCYLPTKRQELQGAPPDITTRIHFRVLYASLSILAALIIANSLLSLYQENHGKGHASGTNSSTTNYPLAAFIMLVWIAPIVILLVLPRKEMVPPIALLLDDDEEEAALLRNEEAINNITKFPPQHTISEEGLDGNVAMDRMTSDNMNASYSSSLVHDGTDRDKDDDDDHVHENTTVPRNNNNNMASNNDVQDKNLYEMLKTPSAWLMIWTTTILVGGGTVETNNLGQMVEALHLPEVVTPASLALFSVAQAAGRVATGSLSEAALNWNVKSCCIENGVPRPFFLMAASLVGILAHTILAISTSQYFFVLGIMLSGVAFGMVWPLMVLIVGEVFGTTNVAANYMFFDGFTSAAGTLLLSKIVAQEVYESHVDTHYSEHDSDGVTCYGPECFRMTHIVIVLLSLTCVGSSAAMLYTSRHSYNKSSLHRR
jgi:hypothetical protein